MSIQSQTASGARAVLVRQDEGLSVRWGPAGTIRILAGAESTDGSFSLVEAIEEPGSAAPLHVHHGEAEAFYVLQGEIELTCGDDTLTARTGDFVYAPRGVPHKYAVVGQQPARVLLLFSRPGFEGRSLPRAERPSTSRPPGHPTPRSFSAWCESTTWSCSRRRSTDCRARGPSTGRGLFSSRLASRAR